MKKHSKITKRLFWVFGVVCLCFLCGCTSEPSENEDYLEEDIYKGGYKDGYGEGYDEGYNDGIAYALANLRDSANDYESYANIEDINKSIHSYLESQNFEGDCCAVTYDIISGPDVKHYKIREILDELIKSCMKE